MSSSSNKQRSNRRKKIEKDSIRFVCLLIAFCLSSLIIGGAAIYSSQSAQASTNQYLGIPGPDDWTDETAVQIYNRSNGQWESMTYGDVEPDNEFIVDDYLYATTPEQGYLFLKPEIDISLLTETDRAFDPDNWRIPKPNDVVFLTKGPSNQQKGHWLLKHVQADSEIVFQGKVWKWELDIENQRFVVSDTGNVFARVTQTHINVHEGDVLALTVRFESCGKTDVITGSEEHPFYVLDIDDYVLMVDLQPDMHLKTDNGSLVTVVGLKPLDGSMELYNLSVEHVQNYYIYTSENDPGVLVHNTGPCDVISQAVSAGLPNRNGVGKTTGILFDANGNRVGEIIISGRNPYSFDNSLVRGTDGSLIIQDHVEAQAAGMMRDLNISDATLVLNNHPCSNGNYTCQSLLPNMVPIGSDLRVIVPDGFDARGVYDQVFTGIP